MFRCLSTNSERVFANFNAMKISVITAVRNDPEGIKKTLETVAQQVCKGMWIEHIIIDGASTDATREIIATFVAKRAGSENPKYKVVHEPDRGIYDAMNKGKQMATGDFIYFLNAGDTFCNASTLAGVCRCINNVGINSAVYAGQVCIHANGHKWLRPKSIVGSQQAVIRSAENLPHHQSTFYPKAFYTNYAYDPDFIKDGDADYSMQALREFPLYLLPIVITHSTLGGFSTRAHSWSETRKLIRDGERLVCRNPEFFSFGSALTIKCKWATKWLVERVVGVESKYSVMRYLHHWREWLRALRHR
jgi:glycosyltransferase involved in cell wall biosynthesis